MPEHVHTPMSKALLIYSNMTSSCPCPLFNIAFRSWMASTSSVSHDMPLRSPCCLEVMMSYLFKWFQVCDTNICSNILQGMAASDTGLYFSERERLPFLKIGHIVALFHEVGSWPSLKDFVKRCVYIGAISVNGRGVCRGHLLLKDLYC